MAPEVETEALAQLLAQVQAGEAVALPAADDATLRDATVQQARRALAETATPDRSLVQGVAALVECQTQTNRLAERLARWAAEVAGAARQPPATELPPDAPGPLRELQVAWRESAARGVRLRNWLELEAPTVAPSLGALLGPLLAARVIAAAGSLARLARMPGSTIQTLGAEKALFAHSGGGAPPPKHGLLLAHPLVRDAPRQQRGKLARRLAAKAAIAARLDCYGGEPQGAELLAALQDSGRRRAGDRPAARRPG